MFHELLDNPKQLDPGVLQTNARREFPLRLKQSHLRQRKMGAAIPSRGKYLIIGIASYSPLDLGLLDDIEAAHSQWSQTSTVDVFDLMECKNMGGINELAPPFTMVSQTPIIAFWDGGTLVSSQTGLRATREVLQSAGVLK